MEANQQHRAATGRGLNSDGGGRAAVFCVIDHRPVTAAMVRAPERRYQNVPAVLGFEPGLVAGAVVVSLPDGTDPAHDIAGQALGRFVWYLYRGLCLVCLADSAVRERRGT